MLGLLYGAAPNAAAQSIKLTPAGPYVAINKTVQFSAAVSGLSSTAVVWTVAGVTGGNATNGKITTAGLYTAPAKLPAQNPVLVKVTSAVNTKVSASTYVNILTAGPTITSVTPNPVLVGTFTTTIKGTGFQPGAVVLDSYGKYSMIQMSTLSVTSTTVTATGYQGPASTATFCVKNSGSDYSNSLTIPVSGGPPPAPTYSLTVTNGTGGGMYTAGTVVNITANAPPSGEAFVDWTGATVSNATASSTSLTMPAANTSVQANYATPGTYALTVVNGTGSGAFKPGVVVTISANAPPAGQVFVNWTGATVTNAAAATTTLTMPTGAATVTANYGKPAVTIPYPVSSHPRVWLTTNDVTRLQGWATASNPIYTQGMAPLLSQAVSLYNTQFFPNGVANPNYPDFGDTQGYTGLITEQVGVVLAFNSLIDPNPAARIKYAQYTRNLLMYAMNQAALGHLANAPFRDPAFAVYNRANETGEQWPLMVDWIYSAKDPNGNAILTSADKATIRNVFMIWANDCLNASTTGGDHPEPIGVVNDLQLLPNDQPYRMAANNYYLGHARDLTMMALSVDPSDDPPINPSLPASQIGNSLRSYILDANGAWLYQEFAMFADPATAATGFGLSSSAGFGIASGGLPPEGMLYGHSYATLLGQLLALQTAGFNNVAYSGPQIQLIGAPMWDRYVTGFISDFVPAAQVFPSWSWVGPVYQFGCFGDVLRLWATPDFMEPFALLAALEQENGKTTHLNTARWFGVNAVEGGADALYTRITQPWSWSTTQSILYYLLLDPAAPAAGDPRPSFPTLFFDPPAGRVEAHSDWTATGTMFDYRASWTSINHQHADGGQFELYRKGEWLTKEMSNYDNNNLGITTMYHNGVALQNWCASGTPNLGWFATGEWATGSQWILGDNAGDPTTECSSGPGYVYATSDLTNLYNLPDIWTPSLGATDIEQATRSILWLNNDYVVVYDRATSLHSGLFKRFNLCLTNNPTISGNTATETLASGQKLFIQTLLPHNHTTTASYAVSNLSSVAILEPTQYILTVQDPSLPTDTRFLHVLQGADANTAMAAATYLQSTSGIAFDGAVFGATAVFFPVNTTGLSSATTFSVPSGVHTLLVTGLVPGASYGVADQTTATGTAITVTPGTSGATADAAGLLRLTF